MASSLSEFSLCSEKRRGSYDDLKFFAMVLDEPLSLLQSIQNAKWDCKKVSICKVRVVQVKELC